MKYQLDELRGSIKLIEETRLIEDAKYAFDKYESDGRYYKIQPEGVYIGLPYFQSLTSNQMKGGKYDFELNRPKFINKLSPKSLMLRSVFSQSG